MGCLEELLSYINGLEASYLEAFPNSRANIMKIFNEFKESINESINERNKGRN